MEEYRIKTYSCSDMFMIPNNYEKFLELDLKIKIVAIKEMSILDAKEDVHTFLCCDSQGNIYEEFQDNVYMICNSYDEYVKEIRSIKRY